MDATLYRLEHSAEETIGVLLWYDRLFCYTLEPPVNTRMGRGGRIPPGRYVCYRRESQKLGKTFEVGCVDGRTNILFHAGNTTTDTTGCILLGTTVGHLNGARAVLSSRKAFLEFMNMLEGRERFLLDIREG